MPPGRKKVGRQRVRRMKGIHDAMAERGPEEEEWMGTEEWRLENG
jgi:hypothetical protein